MPNDVDQSIVNNIDRQAQWQNYAGAYELLMAAARAPQDQADVVNRLSESGFTLLHSFIDPDPRSGRIPPARRKEQRKYIGKLLEIEGVDVNARDQEGNTPLARAASRAEPEIVRMLLEHGAEWYHHKGVAEFLQVPPGLSPEQRGEWVNIRDDIIYMVNTIPDSRRRALQDASDERARRAAEAQRIAPTKLFSASKVSGPSLRLGHRTWTFEG